MTTSNKNGSQTKVHPKYTRQLMTACKKWWMLNISPIVYWAYIDANKYGGVGKVHLK